MPYVDTYTSKMHLKQSSSPEFLITLGCVINEAKISHRGSNLLLDWKMRLKSKLGHVFSVESEHSVMKNRLLFVICDIVVHVYIPVFPVEVLVCTN